MFSAIPYQEQIEVKRSNLCWLSILFDFLTFRSLIFYIILYIFIYIYYWYIIYILFMDINTSLEISWTPIVAYKNIEGKNPENTFNFLWWRHYDVKFLKFFWSALFTKYLGIFRESHSGVHYTFWWKIVVPESENFSFFPFIFFIFYIFEKLLTSVSFLFQINFSIFPFLVILAFQKYIII